MNITVWYPICQEFLLLFPSLVSPHFCCPALDCVHVFGIVGVQAYENDLEMLTSYKVR